MKRMMMAALASVLSLFIVALLGPVGCGGSDGDDNDDDPPVERSSYTVSVVNLTHNQPFSPIAAVLHGAEYQAWSAGTAVSAGLEALAEGGDPSEFLAEAGAATSVAATQAGVGVVPPGGTDAIVLEIDPGSAGRLTVATMLVNSNDAFTGAAGVAVDGLAVGETLIQQLVPYDAGTEANTESAATIPGPAGGGEGFNAQRDDRDFVAVHGGVVTAADGLSGSTLDESHRFLSPTATLMVTRTR